MSFARSTRHALILVAACTLTHAWVSEARADKPTAAESPGEKAAKYFRQGNAAFEQKKWAEAEAAYRQAWQLARTFDVAANLGEVLLRLDKPRDAARFLAFSIKAAPPSAKAAHRDRTRHFLEEAKSKVGTIRLRLNVSGARVTLDGAAVDPDEVADELFVDPGRHSLVASHEGHQDARAIFNAAAGSSRDVTLTLAPMEAPRRSIVPGVVMGSAAGVALATGIGLLVGGANKRADARDVSTSIQNAKHSCVSGAANFDSRCASLNDTANSAGTFHNAGVGLLVGAGALAAGTVAYLLWPAPMPSRTGSVRAAPMVSATSAGLVPSGSF